MKDYLIFNKSKTHYSLQHDLASLFKKIEFTLFCFLSIAVFVISNLNKEFSNKTSELFIEISLPIINATSFPFNVAIDLLTNFKELAQARNENEILKVENEQLKSFQIKSLNINRENEELKKTLGFITTRSSSYKIAHVNGRSHKIFNQILHIDAGANIGIKEGLLVSGTKGMIGRVEEVFGKGAKILLATNANSRIPIITSNSRVRGVLVGNNSELMKILYLQKNHSIEVGDRVFTSGDGDTLPPGILIGVVKKVEEFYASVELVENVGNVDIVTIMDYSLTDSNIFEDSNELVQ